MLQDHLYSKTFIRSIDYMENWPHSVVYPISILKHLEIPKEKFNDFTLLIRRSIFTKTTCSGCSIPSNLLNIASGACLPFPLMFYMFFFHWLLMFCLHNLLGYVVAFFICLSQLSDKVETWVYYIIFFYILF